MSSEGHAGRPVRRVRKKVIKKAIAVPPPKLAPVPPARASSPRTVWIFALLASLVFTYAQVAAYNTYVDGLLVLPSGRAEHVAMIVVGALAVAASIFELSRRR